jgi:hypothetical protein
MLTEIDGIPVKGGVCKFSPDPTCSEEAPSEDIVNVWLDAGEEKGSAGDLRVYGQVDNKEIGKFWSRDSKCNAM